MGDALEIRTAGEAGEEGDLDRWKGCGRRLLHALYQCPIALEVGGKGSTEGADRRVVDPCQSGGPIDHDEAEMLLDDFRNVQSLSQTDSNGIEVVEGRTARLI